MRSSGGQRRTGSGRERVPLSSAGARRARGPPTRPPGARAPPPDPLERAAPPPRTRPPGARGAPLPGPPPRGARGAGRRALAAHLSRPRDAQHPRGKAGLGGSLTGGRKPGCALPTRGIPDPPACGALRSDSALAVLAGFPERFSRNGSRGAEAPRAGHARGRRSAAGSRLSGQPTTRCRALRCPRAVAEAGWAGEMGRNPGPSAPRASLPWSSPRSALAPHTRPRPLSRLSPPRAHRLRRPGEAASPWRRRAPTLKAPFQELAVLRGEPASHWGARSGWNGRVSLRVALPGRSCCDISPLILPYSVTGGG